jgi:5-methylcytosine-specific restriction endonuclease McrA
MSTKVCSKCKRELPATSEFFHKRGNSIGYEIEHKTPLSRGGSNLNDNLCLSCEHCNDVKHCRTEEEYKVVLCQLL